MHHYTSSDYSHLILLFSAKFEPHVEHKLCQRTKEQAFPQFVHETVEATEWQSDEPFEDPEGLTVLPSAYSSDVIAWKRPSELSLGELPLWHKFQEEEVKKNTHTDSEIRTKAEAERRFFSNHSTLFRCPCF